MTQANDASGEYTVVVASQEDQLGLSRSYSDSQVLYSSGNDAQVSKSHQLNSSAKQSRAKAKPPRPPAPTRNSAHSSVSSQFSCPLFRDLTPSPSPTALPEDPPYQTPIDALNSPLPVIQDTTVEQEVVRTVSDCPVRLVRVRGSSRRKHQPVKRVSGPNPPPMLKSLSLDCLDELHNSDDDYEEIYSNPFDCINTTASTGGSKPTHVHVTARLSTSSAGIPGNCRPPSRQSNTSQVTSPRGHSNLEKSRSVDCLDEIKLSDNPDATSALLQRRRIRNRHVSLDDSVKRLRAKKGLNIRKTSMEIQTYPESPQHLKGVGSQEKLFFLESSNALSTTATTRMEESTDSVLPLKNKVSNGIGTPPKGRNHKKKVQSKPSLGGLTHLFKKKPKDT